MSLEDGAKDVIAKAMRGLGLDAESLAVLSGVPVVSVREFVNGDMDPRTAERLCPHLGLHAGALLALERYLPLPLDLPGVRRIMLPFGEWVVNAWEVRAGSSRLLFDTGFGDEDILGQFSPEDGDLVLTTHPHPDHIGGNEALSELGVTILSETDALSRGAFSIGEIGVIPVDLAGHCTPATGYFLNGLSRRLFVAGDAIFAGSMGGCKTEDAHRLAGVTLRAALEAEDDDLVILPGHGPATTLGEERRHNAFLHRFA